MNQINQKPSADINEVRQEIVNDFEVNVLRTKNS